MDNIDYYVDKCFRGELFSKHEYKLINLQINKLLKLENNLIYLNGDFKIVGDIHGYF